LSAHIERRVSGQRAVPKVLKAMPLGTSRREWQHRILAVGKTAVWHTSAEFVAFPADIVVNQPRGKEICVIADNLSAL
jgi:hypothetical protein